MVRRLLLVLGITFAFASTSLFALGLGEIKLKSGLNQPLDAEILLLSVRGETEDQLRGMLASSADFDRAGIERYYFLTKIRFSTITKPNGQKFLKLTTDEPVKEPFLNFLVDLEWPNGRLLREYTLLLDPPIFDDSPSSTVIPAAPVKEVQPQVEPAQQTTQTTRPTVQPITPSYDGDVYGPTDSSDTLWNIAKKVRPNTSISMHQAMISLFEANPQAFMKGNINHLKRGATLRIPDEAGFKQISQRDALRMIAAHNQAWKSGTSMPKVVMDTSSGDSYQAPVQTQTSSGRLSLSTEDEATGPGSASSALIEEENEVLKQQKEELEAQLENARQLLEQQNRLLELKNEQLATIQNKEGELVQEPASNPQSNTNNAMPETTVPESTVPAETEQAKPEMQTPDMPVVEPSLMEQILSGAYNLYLIIVGVIILVLGAFFMFRKSDDEIDYQDAVPVAKKPEPSIVDEAQQANDLEQTADDIFPDSADDIVSSEEDPFEELVTEEDDADPIGEADIYIAYGKYEQAEALLEQAIQSQPDRIELSTKLLECYAEMNDEIKFANRVEQIKVAMHSDTELANHIKDLYSTAWPQGQLFSDADEPTADTVTESDIPSTEDVFGEAAELIDDEVEDLPIASDEVDLEIDEDEISLDDFVTEQLENDEPAAVETESEPESETEEQAPESQAADPFGSETVSPADRPSTTTDDDEDDDGDDYINTQLDLAKAYVEMGDIEGTREILEEVMTEGSDKQKAKAQKILDSLG